MGCYTRQEISLQVYSLHLSLKYIKLLLVVPEGGSPFVPWVV